MNFNFNEPYNYSKVEDKIYKLWELSGFFNPDKLPKKHIVKNKKYVIYMPLPNITGTLHMGHVLNNTMQDIVARYYRMKGYKTLWLPGTDHAGIATQYVIEKELKKNNITRFQLGREKFIAKAWEWKNKYGDIILNQLKKLGVSCDWSRTRFTMDENYSKDVLQAFIHYYNKGWIYQGKRTVNWCPRCHTTLSDLELDYKQEKGKLWYIKYPFVDSNFIMIKHITVATTRPETMFGDTAIAVNPNDEKYKTFINKKVIIPLADREIPIISDIKIDPKFGTGAVKITPAHDILDYEIGKRHNLESIQVIDDFGRMNENTKQFSGLKTQDAREQIIQELKNKNLIEKEEDYIHNIATCSRCGQVIEPIPSNQWFLKMDQLAKYALQAVKKNQVKIKPKNFQKIYLNWLNNIQDWAISRQIWWGHRLPVYFCTNNPDNYIVTMNKPKQCPFCKKCEMQQSTDVLDTWFSSALWPFAGLTKNDQKNFYPGNLVVTARDIINLWIARMIFSGIEFKHKPPFQDVIIHGTILTKEGKRMSKSLGTGIDPLNYISNYGADATRFGIIWQATGQDIKWDEASIIAGKKFANKIWNASRFIIMQTKDINTSQLQKIKPLTTADKQIIKQLKQTKLKVEKNINNFEFTKALQLTYKFFWHQFCDKYIETSKKQLSKEKIKLNTQIILAYSLLESLKLINLFMPFITEAIYQNLPYKSQSTLLIEKW
ncbi:MAG: valine--tRNA ligase [Minisyncoccia bacterium]